MYVLACAFARHLRDVFVKLRRRRRADEAQHDVGDAELPHVALPPEPDRRRRAGAAVGRVGPAGLCTAGRVGRRVFAEVDEGEKPGLEPLEALACGAGPLQELPVGDREVCVGALLLANDP